MFKQETFQLDASYILVVVILAAILISILFMKSRLKSPSSKGRELKVTEQVYLDNKNKVSVVEYKNSKFVIVIGPSGVAITDDVSKNSD